MFLFLVFGFLGDRKCLGKIYASSGDSSGVCWELEMDELAPILCISVVVGNGKNKKRKKHWLCFSPSLSFFLWKITKTLDLQSPTNFHPFPAA